jgi:hypothetical protein
MSEDREFIIGARIDDVAQEVDKFKEQDPFSKSWDYLKNLSGLDNNFALRSFLTNSTEENSTSLKHCRMLDMRYRDEPS